MLNFGETKSCETLGALAGKSEYHSLSGGGR